jgi:hypothetical protein
MTLFGPDVSLYQQGLVPPDPHGVGFGICRASIGQMVDTTAPGPIRWCRDRKVPFAAYHFVYPTSSHPAAAQADTFHRSVGGDRSINCMIDWESDTNDNCHPDGGAQQPTWDDAVAVADAIRALGHKVPLLYTGNWYWSQQGRPTMSGHGLDLVASNYGAKPWPTGSPSSVYAAMGGDIGPGWTSYGGLIPVIWQFSCQTTWGNKQLDMNAYRGDPIFLSQWFTTWEMTTMTTFPYGYAKNAAGVAGMGTMLTMAQYEAKRTVYNLHPEFWRRFKALMEYAATQGVHLGVGTGWRIQPNPPPPGFAQPGNSNHEGFPADGKSGGAVAIDAVCAPAWPFMEKGLKAYGLRSFIIPSTTGYKGKNEPWHVQPVEIPASRAWRKTPWQLPTFPLPGAAAPTPPPTGDNVNWNPTAATVSSVKDAPPVAETVANKWNDWAVIAMLKTVQRSHGLPITGKYDQPTATAIDNSLAGK